MRILILGAGATGGYFGARLDEAGANVSFLVRRPRARQMEAGGLAVESPCGNVRRPVTTVLEGGIASPYDLVMLSCKAFDLDSAMDAVAPAVGPNSVVLPLLNGLAHYAPLDARFGRHRVAGGNCHLAATLGAAGEIRHLNAVHRIVFGLRTRHAGQAQAALADLAGLFARTRVECRFTDNVMQEVWEKFVFIASLAAMTCLMRAAVGDITASDAGRTLMRETYDACAATAAFNGYPPRPQARDEAVAALTDRASTMSASMLRDLEAGRRIEAEHIVGDMLRHADAARIEPGLLRVAHTHLQSHAARRARESTA